MDGLAMVVGIMVGSGIFRTRGLVAAQLGRPWLTLVGWLWGGVVALAFAEGTGAGRHSELAGAPQGLALWAALGVAAQPVIWTYYGYPEAAKIAEEVVDPEHTLPRVFLGGIAVAGVLYLLLNAAFLHVLPLRQIAGSKLVAADVASARSEEHTSELQSHSDLVCRLLLEKKKKKNKRT